MEYRMTRRTALGAAGAFLISLAATGCGSDDSDSDTDSKDLANNKVGAMDKYAAGDQFKATEALKFSIMYSNHPSYQLKADWLFWSELAKRTNVTFEPTTIPMSDYESKRSLLIGSGQAPSIIPKTYPPAQTKFVASGAILAVSDYLDLMPNLQAKIKKWNLSGDIDTLRESDGKFYILPGLHEDVWKDYTFAIRTDILQQLNLKVPTTWEELRTVLKAMKTAYPDSYPLSDRFNSPTPGGNLLNLLTESYGTYGGWNYQNACWDSTAKKFVFTGAMDAYKQAITYLNTLFKEGLLDPECFTQTDDTAKQKLATNKSFVISTNAQNLVNDYRPALAKSLPNATIAKIPVPMGLIGKAKTGTRIENGVMISAKVRDSKNFVAMMQLIDWLWYSDAGQEFAKWGVEGTTYTKDSSGKRTLAADVDFVGLNPKGTKHLQKDFGFSNGIFAYGGSTDLLHSTFSAEELAFQKEMDSRKTLELPPSFPLTEEEREQATLWETPLKDHVSQMTLQFILGKRDLAQWDAYVSELKSKNMQAYVDLVNKAHDRFAKTKK